MKGNKEAFIKTAIARINEIDPGNPSIKLIEESLRKMTSEQFTHYIEALRNGISDTPDLDKPREILPIVVPHMSKTNIKIKRNIQLLEKYKIPYFERVWMVDSQTGTRYLTNRKHVILKLPLMRQAQTQQKGTAVAESNIRLDDRTGQVASTAKGASFSGPELQAILSQGRMAVATELMKFRGGDDKAFRAMNNALIETGDFNQEYYPDTTRAKSTDVLAMYFKACHIDNDL